MKKFKALFIVLIMVIILSLTASFVFAEGETPEETENGAGTGIGSEIGTDATETVRITIDDFRPYTNWIYVLKAPLYSGDNNFHKIFKIGKKSADYSSVWYCLRAGKGVGDVSVASQADEGDLLINMESPIDGNLIQLSPYTYEKRFSNMRNDETINNIKTFYSNNFENNTLLTEQTYNGGSTDYVTNGAKFTPYYSILWLIDNMALIHKDGNNLSAESETTITQLLNNAGIAKGNLTTDDIDVVQGIALWYFSNYDSNMAGKFLTGANGVNNKTLAGQTGILTVTKDRGNYYNGSSITGARATDINQLYNYLIGSAVKNGKTKPSNGTQTTPKVTIENSGAKVEEKNNLQIPNVDYTDFYVVGPFKITEETSVNINYTSFNINYVNNLNAQKTYTGPKYLLKEGVYDPNSKLEKNKEFKIAIPKSEVDGGILEFSLSVNYEYSVASRNGSLWIASGHETKAQPILKVESSSQTKSGTASTTVENKHADFALRKYITSVNGTSLVTNKRTPTVDATKLQNGTASTAVYKHRKDPVEVNPGDKVTYTITVYNEGNVPGKVTKIKDRLPSGLALNASETNGKANGKYTATQTGNDVMIEITEDYSLEAYTTGVPKSKSIQIVCNVTESQREQDQTFTNIAEITEYVVNGITINKENNTASIKDIDSDPESNDASLTEYWGANGQSETTPGAEISDSYYKGIQDDDDFEKVIIKGVNPDFALRKYITAINGEDLNGEDSRVPDIDTSSIAKTKTATYKHMKVAVKVKKNDKVTYTISVYNEGEIKGKVTKIVDHLPEGLALDADLTNAEANGNYAATQSGNDVTITITDRNAMLPAFEDGNLSGYSVKLVCTVTKEATAQNQVLTNIAEIAAYQLEGNVNISDRDSTPGNNKAALTDYWGAKGQSARNPGEADPESYYKGQEDDDDFEKVVIEGITVKSDFALRKYITKVNGVELSRESSRVPSVNFDNIKPKRSTINETTTATYKHRKDPVVVNPGDTVTYKISVYNEGSAEGSVTEIVDYLPEGLEFDAKSNPDFIETKKDYSQEELSKYKYSYQVIGNKLIIRFLEDYTLNPLTSTSKKLDQKDVEITLKVTAKASDKEQVLTNIAEITEYKVNGEIMDESNEHYDILKDRDSNPGNTTVPTDLTKYWGADGQNEKLPGAENSESYYEGQQDDDDFEKVKVEPVHFDLALRKFISSVKRDGKEILEESREPIVDVTPLKNGETTASYTHPKIDKPVVVKNGDIITYTIRVYNEGDIDGYVNSIIDHIPQGLEFIVDSEVNTKFEWEYIGPSDLTKITTDYWAKGKVHEIDGEDVTGLIKAYDGGDTLDYRDVQVEFKVTALNSFSGSIINIAEIETSVAVDENGDIVNVTDIDSQDPVDKEHYDPKPAPENSTYQEDDDDYEVVELKFFDLALRKFITAVNEEELKGRVPEARYSTEKGMIEYLHPKTPVDVNSGDLVTYTIRVYNEGTIAGYAEEVADDIPAGLKFVPSNETNKDFKWKMVDKDGNVTDDVTKAVRVTTDYLSEANGKAKMGEDDEVNPNLIRPFDFDKDVSNVEPYNPDFRDVKIVFQVDVENVPEDRVVTNHAQITKDSDDDEDSTPDKWNEGEDDQDIEKIKVRIFDLSLQKWVTKTIVTVDGVTTITETGFKPNVGLTDQDGRPNTEGEPIAQVVIDKKKLNSTVVKFVYSIKVANEGEIAGYATEITDYIPEGLEFIEEDNPLWKKVGDNKITTNALEETELKPGESAVLEVVFTWINNENNFGLKKNIAAITEDYNDANDTPDIDSTPGNTNTEKYEKEQEDDDDFAQVMLTIKTGGENTYIAIALVALAIITTGTLFIKRYVV